MLEYHNIKYFCNGYVPNSSEEAFVIKKVKNTVLWALLLVTLKTKKILEHFTKKKIQKRKQKEFWIEKVIKRNDDKLYVKGKVMIIHLIVGLIKKT